MSEKHLKLKLKRKKAAIQGEQHSTIVVKKSTRVPIPSSSFESDLRSEATGDPYDSKPGVWWDRPDIQAVEKLWAVVLASAIPNLGHCVWETVPDLPLASPVACPVKELSGWKWCGLNEEVGPLPSPPKPPACPSRRGPDHQPRSTDTSPDSEGAKTPPNPGQQKGHPHSVPVQDEVGEGTSAQNPGPLVRQPGNGTGRRPQSALSSWGLGPGECVDWPRASGGGAREEKGAAGRAWLEGTGGGEIRRRLPACAVGGSDGRTESPVGEGGVSGSARAHRNSAGGAAAAMETCPMCLLPFPSGFTQMQCDSHLAKCLSEMSEDIAW